jgi:murein DD-endopeptidase MepM/ murein hydrolase activator NlpD
MHPSLRPLSGRLRRAAVACAALFLAACAGRAEAPASSPARGSVYVAPGASLAMPVRGVRAEQLRDTYSDARSGGRVHHAIDIMAPRGTPVLAAEDGTILKLRTGGMGGITIYQLGTDGRTLYYYAHLQRYAAGLREGLPIARGQVVAYVGDTGNAGAGNYHLHFSVSRLSDPRRWWQGENVNPYPMLAGVASRSREGR